MATEADACRNLAVAVLRLAICDATGPVNTHNGMSANRPEVYEQADARDFCTALSGQWAVFREFWCSLADIDPDKYRATAVRLLAAQRAPITTLLERIDA